MNWTTLISELSAAGLTQPQIAERCDCAQTTISDLATGKSKEPRYGLASRLIKLHEEVHARTGAATEAAK